MILHSHCYAYFIRGPQNVKTHNTRHSPCRPIMLFSIFLFMELAQAQEILIEKLKEYGM